jgi:hypothetical protein
MPGLHGTAWWTSDGGGWEDEMNRDLITPVTQAMSCKFQIQFEAEYEELMNTS